MTTTEQLRAVPARLRAAAALIERDGWHKGDFFDPATPGDDPRRCPKCAVGALVQAATGNPDGYRDGLDLEEMPEVGYFADWLFVHRNTEALADEAAWTIAAFNDAATNVEQVLAALREAAADWAAGLTEATR